MINIYERYLDLKNSNKLDNNDSNLRDYQQESINMIIQNKKNVIINLPTGKNIKYILCLMKRNCKVI
jgi:hypothetical protein